MILTPSDSQSLAIHSDVADVSIDATGRWKTFRTEKGVFRNTLSGEVVHSRKRHVEVLNARQRSLLKSELVRELKRFIHLAEKEGIPEDESSIKDPDRQIASLEKGLDWLRDEESDSKENFRAVYPEEITMLPPDRYKDIVVLPATGCPHSECTFCSLYDDAGFKPLGKAQFQKHLKGIKSLFGEAIEERTGIFMGSASALSLGQRRMVLVLEQLIETFGFLKRGVATFFDPYHAPERTVSDYAELEALGLRQATIGLESGLPELRGLWGKSPELNPFKDAVKQLKEANIQVALTVLTSFDKGDLHREHTNATIDVLRDLPLSPTDIIYLSPYFPARMSEHESLAQLKSFKKGLKEVINAKVVSYHVDRFHYFV